MPEVLDANAALERFSAQRAQATLRRILPERDPHPLGSARAGEVRVRLVEALEALGATVEVQTSWVRGKPKNDRFGLVHNLVASFPGSEPGPHLLGVAHYDSVSAGPGENDDLAGCVAWIEALRAFRSAQGAQPRLGVRLLFTEGEELGLYGARAFVRDDPDLAAIGLVVNLEARGSRGPSRLFQTSLGNRPWVELYRDHAPNPMAASLYVEVYRRMPNDTDLSVFLDRGLAGLNFAYVGGWSDYHSPLDRVEGPSLRSLQHQGDNVLALLEGLEQDPSRLQSADPKRDPDWVHLDVLGTWLWAYPVSVQWGAALAGLALALMAWLRFLTHSTQMRRWLVACLLWPCVVALPLALAWGATRGLEAWRGVHPLFWSRHLPGALLGAGALALAWSWVIPRLRRLGSEAWSLANLTWMAGLGVGTAHYVPGAGYLFLGAALGLGLVVHGLAVPRWPVAQVLLTTLLWVLWVPLHGGLLDAFGFSQAGALLGPLVLPSMLLIPASLGLQPAVSRWMGATGALLAVFVVAVVGLREPYTPQRPGTLDVVAIQEEGHAGWQGQLESKPFRVPGPVLEDWKQAAWRKAPLAAGEELGPQVTWREAPDAESLVLELHSTRAAPTFLLSTQTDALAWIEIQGRRWKVASHRVLLHGVPPEGVIVRLGLGRELGESLDVSEVVDGLPSSMQAWVRGVGPAWSPRRLGHRTRWDRSFAWPER
ncbi:MAG: M20/M25/M40 family metallo-hydrolase [Planctomycetes bacterium]|nr:M20/M25/M40 family metallo-hydrolase [Planctomycetota bacterium]